MTVTVIRPPQAFTPHLLVAVIEKATGDTARFSVVRKRDDGHINTRHDALTETIKLVAEYESYTHAQNARMEAARHIRFHPKKWDKLGHELPSPDARFPVTPRERADLFRSMGIEEQEEVLYSLTTSTGLPRKSIAAWLFVSMHELDHIDEAVTESARAELDLRIASKMIQFATLNKSPAAMTAALYLTKVFLNWTENGIGQNPEPNLEAAKSLFDNLSVVDTNRDQMGTTLTPPTHLKVVKADAA